ncbi:MAG: putative lipid II flippase FtsW [Candidatus Omnitrophota bacterium]|nr:putative lipid II flippase FtsW [Candidatus Omnitrophota bacterium]
MSREARIIFAAAYLLTALGIAMTYSASAVFAEKVYGNAQYFLIRQVSFAAVGTLFLFLVAAVPVSFWKRQSRLIMVVAIIGLMLVYIEGLGRSAGGARRWIQLGGFSFQPAEFAKIAVCLYLADYLSRKIKLIQRGNLNVFTPPFIVVGLVCALIIMQPDLGSCLFILISAAVLFIVAGLKLRFILISGIFFIPAFYYLIMRVPYRLSRVTAYLNPWDDPQGSGFQIIQSFLAFGLGGIKGVGLGQSAQKLFYLPSSYNDFIFSVIAEEFGLVGILTVLLLYAVIFIMGIRMILRAERDYDRLFIYSLVLLIVLQALINMLVATGLVPTKGLPLPFVSYGGTSLVFNMIIIGLLASMDRQMCATHT